MSVTTYRGQIGVLVFERLLAALRYRAATARDLRIDLLRGFSVFAMVVDHIGGASWLFALTGGNQFVVSAAEGFVFLSGFLVGVVYRRVVEVRGVWAGLRKAVERAVYLYVLAIALAVGFGFASSLAGQWWGIEEIGDPFRFAIDVATLQRAYYLADVMLLYAFLLAATPIAVLALRFRLAPLVVATSVGLWLAFQLSPTPIEVPWHIHENTVFKFAPWQVLFFLAMVLGWHRRTLGARVARVALHPAGLAAGIGIAAGLIALWGTDPAHLTPVLGDDAATKLYDLFDKSRLPIARLFAIAIFFQLGFAVTTLAWAVISRAFGWLLLPFGEHSLMAYSLHLFMLVGIGLVTSAIPDFDPWSIDANTLAQLGLILVLWAIVRTSSVWRKPVLAVPLTVGRAVVSVLPFRPGWRPTWWQLGAGAVAAIVAVAVGQVAWPGAFPCEIAWRVRSALPAEPATAEEAPRIIYVRPTTLAAEPLGEVLPLDLETIQGDYVGHLRNGWLYSPILDRERPYLIYLPPDYFTSQERYPTVYLLHGVGGHYGEWFGYGFLNEADRMIAAGEVAPMIFVLPQGDQDYWINLADGGPRWADYMAYDVVRHIDSNFRTIADPEHRAIGGLSMGAHGALQIGFNHPDVFGVIGAHSPSIRTFDESPLFFGDEEYFQQYDPVSLAGKLTADRKQVIWLDRGEDDIWYEQTDKLAQTLQARGVDFIWNILPGEHDGFYWEANAPVYLKFYADVLYQ